MGTDKVAIAFAAWVEAHKKSVECEKRMKEALRVSRQMGTIPPEELAEECRQLRQEADRLLAEAEAQMRASGRKP